MPDGGRTSLLSVLAQRSTASWQPWAVGGSKAALDAGACLRGGPGPPRASPSMWSVLEPPMTVVVACRPRYSRPLKRGTRVAGHRWGGWGPRPILGTQCGCCVWTKRALSPGKPCMSMGERPLWTPCFPSTFSGAEGRQVQAGLGTAGVFQKWRW